MQILVVTTVGLCERTMSCMPQQLSILDALSLIHQSSREFRCELVSNCKSEGLDGSRIQTNISIYALSVEQVLHTH